MFTTIVRSYHGHVGVAGVELGANLVVDPVHTGASEVLTRVGQRVDGVAGNARPRAWKENQWFCGGDSSWNHDCNASHCLARCCECGCSHVRARVCVRGKRLQKACSFGFALQLAVKTKWSK